MHLTTRNINTAFREMVEMFYLSQVGCKDSRQLPPVVQRPSRNGNVLVLDEPVTITYTNPLERVLFNQARDTNPFGLLYEALYMLVGRNDVAPLAYYTKQFNEYSDDGKTLNGSYGYRWRKAWTSRQIGSDERINQLDLIAAHLRNNPTSRRAVLSMWEVESDLLKIGDIGNRMRCKQCHGTGAVSAYSKTERDQLLEELDGCFCDDGRGLPECARCLQIRERLKQLDAMDDDASLKCPTCDGSSWVDEPGSKDVCCNLNVMFSIREVQAGEYRQMRDDYSKPLVRYLDITVTNRSNDMIWGALGANFVTFSVLLEYMAARIGVGVGRYHHFSNNMHVYDWNWKPTEWLAEEDPYFDYDYDGEPYFPHVMRAGTVPLVHDPATFDRELPLFVERHSRDAMGCDWGEPFLASVAQPLCIAFHQHKRREYHNALATVSKVKADDWRVAGTNWLNRRYEHWMRKAEGAGV